MTEGDLLASDLRIELESVLLKLAQAGHIPDRGEREVVFRLDEDHRVRWFQPTRLKVPASELGADAGPPVVGV